MPALLKQVEISPRISEKLELWDHGAGWLGQDILWSWPKPLVIMTHGSWYCATAVSLLTLDHHWLCNKQIGWCAGDLTPCNQALWSLQRTVLSWHQPLLHSLLIPYAERTQIKFKHYHYEVIGQFGQLTYVLPCCFSWQRRRESKQGTSSSDSLLETGAQKSISFPGNINLPNTTNGWCS